MLYTAFNNFSLHCTFLLHWWSNLANAAISSRLDTGWTQKPKLEGRVLVLICPAQLSTDWANVLGSANSDNQLTMVGRADWQQNGTLKQGVGILSLYNNINYWPTLLKVFNKRLLDSSSTFHISLHKYISVLWKQLPVRHKPWPIQTADCRLSIQLQTVKTTTDWCRPLQISWFLRVQWDTCHPNEWR